MTLLSLPNELLGHIWREVVTRPEDVASFAASCKQIHSNGEKVLLEHQRRVGIWSHLTIIGGYYPICAPLDLLCDLFNDLPGTRYIKTIRYTARMPDDDERESDADERERCDELEVTLDHISMQLDFCHDGISPDRRLHGLDAVSDLMMALDTSELRKTRQIDPIPWPFWWEQIAVYLLALLSLNATRLHVKNCPHMSQIFSSSLAPSHPFIEEPTAVLNRITDFEAVSTDTNSYTAVSSMNAIFQMSSIRRVVVWGAGDDVSSTTRGLPMARPSTVEEVFLGASSLHAQSLEMLVSQTPHLRTFCLDYLPLLVSDSGRSWSIRRICEVLEEATGDTLERLSLTWASTRFPTGLPGNVPRYEPHERIASLRGFKKIKDLEIQASAIEGLRDGHDEPACWWDEQSKSWSTQEKHVDLQNVLPLSLETLRMCLIGCVRLFNVASRALASSKKAAMPHWKYAALAFPTPLSSTLSESDIFQPLEEAGVACVWAGSCLRVRHYDEVFSAAAPPRPTPRSDLDLDSSD